MIEIHSDTLEKLLFSIRMRYSESRSGIANAVFVSSYDTKPYIPKYLRVSWWIECYFKTQRITRQFSKLKLPEHVRSAEKETAGNAQKMSARLL